MFDIRVLCILPRFEGLVIEAPRPAGKGEIVINEHQETFYAPLDEWSRAEYEAQWEAACRRLSGGARRSCFVVSVHPPNIARFVEVWAVWRLASAIRVQNLCILIDEVAGFDPHEPYDAIKPYSNVTEDGDAIIEWELPLDTWWSP